MGAPSPTPGWYPDPSGSRGARYWDGARWTDRRHVSSNKGTWIIVGAVLLLFGACAVGAARNSDHDISPMDKDGTYYHIDDSAAGIYETRGSARPNSRPCNWMRLSEDWVEDDSIAALADAMIDRGDVSVGESARVRLRAGEWFVSHGCHPWRYVD